MERSSSVTHRVAWCRAILKLQNSSKSGSCVKVGTNTGVGNVLFSLKHSSNFLYLVYIRCVQKMSSNDIYKFYCVVLDCRQLLDVDTFLGQ